MYKFLFGFAVLLLLACSMLSSCNTFIPGRSLKQGYLPPDQPVDTVGPKYFPNVSDIPYWDRLVMSANATNFAWYDSLGKIHEMTRDYEGKVIVLTFFSTWSDLAVQQFPDLITLHHELVDSNVIFMASSMKEGVQGSKLVMMLDTFVRAHNIDFQVLAGSLDFSWTYGGVSRVPTTFIVSHRGHVTATLEGKQTIAELKKEIWRARNK